MLTHGEISEIMITSNNVHLSQVKSELGQMKGVVSQIKSKLGNMKRAV